MLDRGVGLQEADTGSMTTQHTGQQLEARKLSLKETASKGKKKAYPARLRSRCSYR